MTQAPSLLAPANTDGRSASLDGEHAVPVPSGTTMPSMSISSAQPGANDIAAKGVMGGCGRVPDSAMTLPFVY